MSQPDSDGFVVVKAKSRRSRSSNGSRQAKHCSGGFYSALQSTRKALQLPDPTVERFINEIISKQRTLKKSKFYESLTPVMDAIKEFAPEEIVCYGIGSLHSTVPQWQLALALIFNDTLHVPIHSFDPVTTADDIAMLCHFGVSPIAENEEGRRRATKRTLFYMPHCEQFLYENTVSENWSYEHIGQTMIIGNHFSRYQDTQSEQQFTQSSPRIKSVLPHLTVIDMPAESSLGLRHCPYAFSDMCIQYIIPPDAANIEFSAA